MEVLKVSSRSNPNSVAGAMAGVLRRERAVEVTVVGAGALNQAIKAIAIAREHTVAEGLEVVCVPRFTEITIDDEARTAIRLLVEHRPSVDGAAPAAALDLRVAPVVDLTGAAPQAEADPL